MRCESEQPSLLYHHYPKGFLLRVVPGRVAGGGRQNAPCGERAPRNLCRDLRRGDLGPPQTEPLRPVDGGRGTAGIARHFLYFCSMKKR